MKTRDRKSIEIFLEIGENFSLLNIVKGWDGMGWGGVRRRRSQNVFLGPHGAGIVDKNVPADRSTVGSNP